MTDEPRYLLTKRGLYEKPGHHGYTGIRDEAGRFRASEARQDEGVEAIHENDAPEFAPACWDDIAREHLTHQRDALRERVAELEEENSILAAGACDEGDQGLIGDEFGNQFCQMRRERDRQKQRADNHWETLRSIRQIAKEEGDLERIILWVNDAGSGYTASAEQTLVAVCNELNQYKAERDRLAAALREIASGGYIPCDASAIAAAALASSSGEARDDG